MLLTIAIHLIFLNSIEIGWFCSPGSLRTYKPNVSSPIWIESRRTNSSESSLGPTLQTDRFVGPTWMLFFPTLLAVLQGRAKNHIHSQAWILRSCSFVATLLPDLGQLVRKFPSHYSSSSHVLKVPIGFTPNVNSPEITASLRLTETEFPSESRSLG